MDIEGSEKEKMLALQQKFHLHTIVNTRGDKGAAVLDGDKFVEHPGFQSER